MSGLQPGSAPSRIAAIGLALALAALAWLLVAVPLLSAQRDIVSELDTVRTLRDRLYAQALAPRRGRAAGGALVAPTAAVAAAGLQTRLQSIVEETGASIDRLEASPLPGRQRTAGLDPVRTIAAFTATTAQLRQILLTIARDPVAMIVDELSVRAEAGATDERLRVELGVRAFRSRTAGR